MHKLLLIAGFDLMWSQLTGSTTAPEDMRYMLDKGDAKFVDVHI